MTLTLTILGLTTLFYTTAALIAMTPRLFERGAK